MRKVAESSNMLGIVFLTVVPQNFCSQPWNATQDFFEETQPGLVSQFLECKPSAMFVYDRCGQLVDELKMFSTSPQDEVHEWRVIREAYNEQCHATEQPQPEIETTTAPSAENNPS